MDQHEVVTDQFVSLVKTIVADQCPEELRNFEIESPAMIVRLKAGQDIRARDESVAARFRNPANVTYGNTPLRIAQLRGPKTINEDIALLKNFHIAEKRYFEFRLSAFNALNRHIFPGPDTNMASATFGFITSPQGNTPRNVQLGVRFYC